MRLHVGASGVHSPSNPVLRASPPGGDGWMHEIKFDGYRAQLHKNGDVVMLLSKSRKDFTARFKPIARPLALLPAKRAIIEIVASDAEGRFRALHTAPRKASVFGASTC